MKKSATTEQTVSLNRTDFEKTTKLRKPACSFAVEIIKGRMNSMHNQSVPARDLVEILQEDEVTRNMTREQQYAISLNSDFILSIKNITPVEAAIQEESN